MCKYFFSGPMANEVTVSRHIAGTLLPQMPKHTIGKVVGFFHTILKAVIFPSILL